MSHDAPVMTTVGVTTRYPRSTSSIPSGSSAASPLVGRSRWNCDGSPRAAYHSSTCSTEVSIDEPEIPQWQNGVAASGEPGGGAQHPVAEPLLLDRPPPVGHQPLEVDRRDGGMRTAPADGGRGHGLDDDDVRPPDVDRARRRLDGDPLVVDRRDHADDVGEGWVRARGRR